MLNIVSPTSQVQPKGTEYLAFKSDNQGQRRTAYSVTQPQMSDEVILQKMMQEQQKKEKKQKAGKTAMTALQVAALLSMVAIGWPAIKSIFSKGGSSGMQKEMGIKSLDDLKKDFMQDVGNAKSLKELYIPKTLQDTTDYLINGIKNVSEAMQKGGEALKTIFLYGPPGTGKTSYAKGIAKELEADFYLIDMAKLKQPLHGVTEQNISSTFNMVCREAEKLAKEGNDKKIVVFLDEIDSVMMEDLGNGAKLSNDILNQFKVCFNSLLEHNNVITIGASNLEIDSAKAMLKGGKTLNDAMMSRFKHKVLVDLPTSEQLVNTISAHYKDCSMVDSVLKQKDGKLKEICDLLADKKHETSFRTIESIYDQAYLASEQGKPVTLNVFVDTILKKADDLHLTLEDINKLKSLL